MNVGDGDGTDSMTYLSAIVLGVIQGLTEFLPVSSSGHLVMAQHLCGMDPSTPAMKLFDLAVHVGTVAAVLYYYRQSVRRYGEHLWLSRGEWRTPVHGYQRSASIRFSVLAVTAIFATGVFYVLAKDFVEEGFEKRGVVAVCWLVTAGVLLLTDRRRTARRGLRQFGLMCALLVGLAQGAALFPGVSRSGSTICVAVLLGLHRRWAGEFSFLIGVPTILGATLLEGLDFFRSGEMEALAWGPTLVGMLASAVVGLAALALLIWAVRHAKLRYFAVYCTVLAGATFVWLAVERLIAG